MSTIKYCKHIPIDVEYLLFSKATFHGNVYEIFSENHEFGSEKLDIPIQSDNTLMNRNEQIVSPSDSINSFSNHCDEFHKSDFSQSQSSTKMDSTSSIISEPCLNKMLSEFATKNHNRNQSYGSLDSSHIDIFNNIHIEELDACLRTTSLLGF